MSILPDRNRGNAGLPDLLQVLSLTHTFDRQTGRVDADYGGSAGREWAEAGLEPGRKPLMSKPRKEKCRGCKSWEIEVAGLLQMIRKLEAENDKLKEYKFMYESVSK